MACVTLNGGGEIVARGGGGLGTPGHGGGGGRIKVYTSNNNWLGSIDAGGGAGVNGGSPSASGSFGMIEDLVPLTVTGMNIPPGTTYVGPIDRLEITFSENLYEGTSGIDPDHVLLTDPLGNTLVPDSIEFDTGTQTLTAIYPSTLRQGNYTLMLVSGTSSAGLRDNSGLALDGEYLGSLPSGNGAEGGDFTTGASLAYHPKI